MTEQATEPVAVETITYVEETLLINAPELAQEVGKRVVGGLIKACRAYVPTRENMEGKKEHCDVSLMDGAMYIGTDHSVYAAIIRPKIDEMCKKKSPLRAAFEQLSGKYGARLNYGVASPWLKVHEKNIRTASFGPGGIKLVVAEGLVELDLSLTDETTTYAEQVKQTLDERVLDENRLLGPHPLSVSTASFDVLEIDEEGARYRDRIDLESPKVQLKFKPGMLPGLDAEVSVYEDPEGGKIVRITTDDPTLHVDQYFRILHLTE